MLTEEGKPLAVLFLERLLKGVGIRREEVATRLEVLDEDLAQRVGQRPGGGGDDERGDEPAEEEAPHGADPQLLVRLSAGRPAHVVERPIAKARGGDDACECGSGPDPQLIGAEARRRSRKWAGDGEVEIEAERRRRRDATVVSSGSGRQRAAAAGSSSRRQRAAAGGHCRCIRSRWLAYERQANHEREPNMPLCARNARVGEHIEAPERAESSEEAPCSTSSIMRGRLSSTN